MKFSRIVCGPKANRTYKGLDENLAFLLYLKVEYDTSWALKIKTVRVLAKTFSTATLSPHFNQYAFLHCHSRKILKFSLSILPQLLLNSRWFKRNVSFLQSDTYWIKVLFWSSFSMSAKDICIWNFVHSHFWAYDYDPSNDRFCFIILYSLTTQNNNNLLSYSHVL